MMGGPPLPPRPDEVLKKFLSTLKGTSDDRGEFTNLSPEEQREKAKTHKEEIRVRGTIKMASQHILAGVDNLREEVAKQMDDEPEDLDRMVDEVYDEVEEELDDFKEDVIWHLHNKRED